MRNNKRKRRIILYSSTGLLAATIIFCILLLWDIFNQTDKRYVCNLLSDAFFITGVMYAGVGLLSFIASTGFFDMLAYGFRNFGTIITLPFTYNKNGHEKYYEFVERRQVARQLRKDNAFIIFILLLGLLIIGISGLFAWLVYNYSF